MKISHDWLNIYLDPPCPKEEVAERLTAHGFPVEDVVQINDGPAAGDTLYDVEVTSNRGDCLSHVGVARELAASTGATLTPSSTDLPAAGEAVESITSVDLQAAGHCPTYTARVIRGVSVGPSPQWLVARLEAVGLRPVNNVVDVTNFVLHETGQPLHAFDLDRLDGRRIVVRLAERDEPFVAIDGSKHTLKPDDLVIADASRPVAIAGVMGGLESEVGDATTDILLESAVFDPLSVRTTSRRLKLASDASFRYERGVDPRGLDSASRRAAALIVELAGGTLADGVIRVGEHEPRPAVVTMRVARCNDLLGLDLSADEVMRHLGRIGIDATPGGKTVTATIPTFRLDLTREVDLIEEVARLHGLDHIPTRERIEIVTRPPQRSVAARRALSDVLVAHGYHETITFSFTHPDRAAAFLPEGAEGLMLDDERKRGEPMLRPSLLPSLLACRKLNQDAGNGGVRLFETASTWWRTDGRLVERRRLAVLRDAPGKPNEQEGAFREMRGLVDGAVEAMSGAAARGWLTVEPREADGVYAVAGTVKLQGRELGTLGLVGAATLKRFGITTPQLAGELDVEALLSLYPARPRVEALPRYPAIERDLSVIVDEAVAWCEVERVVRDAGPALLDGLEFVTVYRGKPVAAGRKSVSLRLKFRDPETTLRHEQVDPQVATVVESMQRELDADLRA